jgi:hypothetical protein
MKLTILLTPDGALLVGAPEGTFVEARAAIEALLRDLGQDRLRIVLETPIERHRHDDAHPIVRADLRERPGA